MSVVVSLRRPPSDLASRLREMADEVERGEILDFIASYTFHDEYQFTVGTSKMNAIAMSAMLHQHALDSMREA